MPSAMPRKSENVPSVTMSARNLQPRHEHGVERATGAAHEQRDERGTRRVQPPVAARGAEDDRRESHHRPDRKIDAAGDDDRRQRDRQESELHAEPRDLEEVPGRGEVRRDDGEERDLGRQRDEQDRVTGAEALEGTMMQWTLLEYGRRLSVVHAARSDAPASLHGPHVSVSRCRPATNAWRVRGRPLRTRRPPIVTACVTGRSRNASNATAARMIAP